AREKTVSGSRLSSSDRGAVFVAVSVASCEANPAVARRRHLVVQAGLPVGQAPPIRSSHRAVSVLSRWEHWRLLLPRPSTPHDACVVLDLVADQPTHNAPGPKSASNVHV